MTKRDYGFNLIFAFTLPFVALLRTLKSKSAKFKHQILTILVGIYGSTIVLGPNSDGSAHLARVTGYYGNMPFKQFSYEFYQILVFQETAGGASDLYKHILSYLCGSVLDMPFLFLPIVGLVYGYFFIGSMLHIFKYFYRTKKTLMFWLFALILITLKNVEGVNTVRTWTALWILVYSCLKYYETKKHKYLILMFMPPFVHFSFFIMALPAYVVLVFGNWKKVFFSIFVLSFFFSFLTPNAQAVTDTLSQTELGAKKTEGYYVEEERGVGDIIEQTESGGSTWYRVYTKAGISKYADFLIILSIFLTGTYAKHMNRVEASMFSIGLLTLTLSNVSWFYFALANRSGILGIVFIFTAVVLFWQNPNRRQDTMFFTNKFISFSLILSLVLYVPSLILKTSMLLGFISIFCLITPFAVWISPEMNMGCMEVIKWVLLK